MVLTTEAIVVDKPEPKDAAPAGPGGGGLGGDFYSAIRLVLAPKTLHLRSDCLKSQAY